MIRLNWQGEALDVQRLAVRPDLDLHLLRAVRRVAVRCGLFVVSPAAVPQAGDFWLGCVPDGGWGDSDANEVGWAGWFNLEEAIGVLEETADELDAVAV